MFYFLSCCDALHTHTYSLFRWRFQRKKNLWDQLSWEGMPRFRKTAVVFGNAFGFFLFLVRKFLVFIQCQEVWITGGGFVVQGMSPHHKPKRKWKTFGFWKVTSLTCLNSSSSTVWKTLTKTTNGRINSLFSTHFPSLAVSENAFSHSWHLYTTFHTHTHTHQPAPLLGEQTLIAHDHHDDIEIWIMHKASLASAVGTKLRGWYPPFNLYRKYPLSINNIFRHIIIWHITAP